MEKREEIKTLLMELILSYFEDAKNDVEKAVRSGAVKLDEWSKDKEGYYIIPTRLVTIMLQMAARPYADIGPVTRIFLLEIIGKHQYITNNVSINVK